MEHIGKPSLCVPSLTINHGHSAMKSCIAEILLTVDINNSMGEFECPIIIFLNFLTVGKFLARLRVISCPTTD